MDGGATSSAVARRLASADWTTRNRALLILKTWLSSQSSFVTDDDLIKIWKGLFYCLWHADKPAVQSELINRLSSLIQSLDSAISAQYLDAFLSTLRREWAGIDGHRIDKFYLLIGQVLHHLFLLLRKNSWNLDLSVRLMAVLSERSLLSTDKNSGQGISYHIAEIFLDEIAQVLRIPLETLEAILKPFFTVMEKSDDKVLLKKVKLCVFDRLYENGVKLLDLLRAGGCVDIGDEVRNLGKVALELSISKKFLVSASASEALQGNRKLLFSLHYSFLRLEKELENSGLLNAIQQLDNGDEVEKSEQTQFDFQCDEDEDFDASEESSSGDARDPLMMIPLDEPILQKECEMAAAEPGVESQSTILCAIPASEINTTVPKKRKRAKIIDGQVSVNTDSAILGVMDMYIGENIAKKVRFSMKNNLVWKPNNPLPPQSLRLPPSVTPRGSALKKGVPPGPINETPPTIKKAKVKAALAKKSRKSLKKVSLPPRKGTHNRSPSKKLLPRLKKLRSNSAQ